MGTKLTPLVNGPNDLFPVGATDSSAQAISPETLELRDMTVAGTGIDANDSVDVALVINNNPTPVCTVTPAQICHLASNVQFEVPGQTPWNLRFTGNNLDGGETVTYSYRSVR
jgi:hypothetical protein